MTSVRDDVPQHSLEAPEIGRELSTEQTAALYAFRGHLEMARQAELDAAQRYGETLREGAAHIFEAAKSDEGDESAWLYELRHAWFAAEECEEALRRAVDALRAKEDDSQPHASIWEAAEHERHGRWRRFASCVYGLRGDATGLLNKFGSMLAFLEAQASAYEQRHRPDPHNNETVRRG